MPIVVYRNSDQTDVSAYGRKITENAGVGVEFDNVVRIGFQTVQSSYSILIEPDSFVQLTRVMMKASPNDAIKAFGAALQAGIAPPNSN